MTVGELFAILKTIPAETEVGVAIDCEYGLWKYRAILDVSFEQSKLQKCGAELILITKDRQS